MAPRLLTLSWLRTLVWLLALALPLQVQARVGMLGCGQATHQQHQQMQHGDAPAEHHHEADKAASPHQCSACAACCVGAALLPGSALAPGGPVGHAVL